MGSAISAVRDNMKEADVNQMQKMKQNLMMLQEIATVKAAAMKSDIEKTMEGQKEIPIEQVIRWSSGYRVDVSEDSAAKEIGGVIDNFFGGNLVDGLKSLVKSSVSALLGGGTGGAVEQKHYYIVILNDALVRIDVGYYVYQLSFEGLYKYGQQIFVWQYAVSSVDMAKVKPSTLLFTVTEQTGATIFNAKDDATRTKLLKERARLLQMVRKFYDGKDFPDTEEELVTSAYLPQREGTEVPERRLVRSVLPPTSTFLSETTIQPFRLRGIAIASATEADVTEVSATETGATEAGKPTVLKARPKKAGAKKDSMEDQEEEEVVNKGIMFKYFKIYLRVDSLDGVLEVFPGWVPDEHDTEIVQATLRGGLDNISPLAFFHLVQLRKNVVEAMNNMNSGDIVAYNHASDSLRFPKAWSPETCKDPKTGIKYTQKTSSEVYAATAKGQVFSALREFFVPSTSPSSPKGMYQLECNTAAQVCHLWALAQVLGEERFNTEFESVTVMPEWLQLSNGRECTVADKILVPSMPLPDNLKQLVPGDWVYFENHLAYATISSENKPGSIAGAFAGENAIVSYNGNYEGFGINESTYDVMVDKLQNEFNYEVNKFKNKPALDDILKKFKKEEAKDERAKQHPYGFPGIRSDQTRSIAGSQRVLKLLESVELPSGITIEI